MTTADTTAPLATADQDYVTLPSGTAVEFLENDEMKNVVVTLIDDTSCETDASMDETFRLILEANSEGNLCDTTADDDYTVITILHDDGKLMNMSGGMLKPGGTEHMSKLFFGIY